MKGNRAGRHDKPGRKNLPSWLMRMEGVSNDPPPSMHENLPTWATVKTEEEARRLSGSLFEGDAASPYQGKLFSDCDWRLEDNELGCGFSSEVTRYQNELEATLDGDDLGAGTRELGSGWDFPRTHATAKQKTYGLDSEPGTELERLHRFVAGLEDALYATHQLASAEDVRAFWLSSEVQQAIREFSSRCRRLRPANELKLTAAEEVLRSRIVRYAAQIKQSGPRSLATVHHRPDNGRSRAYPQMAAFLSKLLLEKDWSSPYLESHGGPDRKSINKVRKGLAVTGGVIERLRDVLVRLGVNAKEIPDE